MAAPLAVLAAPCTRVERSTPVEAAAAVAVPVNPRLVAKAVVVMATAEVALLPLLLTTIWSPER